MFFRHTVLLAVLFAPVAVAQNSVFLYESNGISNDVWAYSVNNSTGALVKTAASPFPAQNIARGIAVTPNNQFAYVANAGSNNVSAYVIAPTTRDLTTIPGSPFPAHTSPHSVVIDPTGKFLYAGNTLSNDISAYTINATSGALTPIAGSPFADPVGNIGFSMAIDPTGAYLYAPNPGAGVVSAYAINAITGALTPVPGSPFPAGTLPNWLVVHPSGHYLYTASTSSVYAFQINTSTGALSPVAGSPFSTGGNNGHAIAIDPQGRFMYVANDATHSISAFKINSSGSLSKTAGSPFTGFSDPDGVIVDPSSQFLYLANACCNIINAFQINQTTGDLAEIASSPFASGAEPLNFAFASQVPPVAITLAATPSPAVAQPGVTILTLVASNLPTGTITAANLSVTLQVASGSTGPNLTAQVSGYSAIPVSGGRITFQALGPNVSVPTPYTVLVSGRTSTGIAFASTKPAALTINPPPQVISVSPPLAQPGQTVGVALTGQYTNYVQGSTTANFGAGISVGGAALGALGPVTVTSPTTAVAQLTINPGAAAGTRNVTVATGLQQATLLSGFTVTGPPSLLSVSPNSGPQGQQNLTVTITGQFTHFAQGTSQASFGDAISVGGGALGGFGPLTVLSPTTATAQLNINICAVVGLRTVTVQTGSETVALSGAFSVSNATVWTQINPTGSLPSPRSEDTSVFDATSNRMIIFGGGGPTNPGGVTNEVWILTNANGLSGSSAWVQLTPTGTPPQPRRDQVAVYDAGDNRMIIFGGDISTTGSSHPSDNDTWVLTNANGLGGAPAWIQLLPQGQSPLPRRYSSAGYDPSTNRLTVFGGWTSDLVSLNDVWVLSNANGLGGPPTWTQLAPAGPLPSPRNASFFAFDPSTNRLVIFGGESGQNVGVPPPNLMNDLWVLTNANGLGGQPAWIQLLPNGVSGAPSARALAGGGASSPTPYNPGNNRLLIVGGGTIVGDLNDVWMLLNANGLGGPPTWLQLTNQPVPVTVGGQASYDFSTDRVIQFAETPNNSTYVLSNATNLPVVQPTPQLLSVIPNSGQSGQTLNSTLTGSCTTFSQARTVSNFGAGISVGGGQTGVAGPVMVTSPTAAVATLSIDAVALPGPRTVSVTTNGEVVSLTTGFSVTGTPTLLSISPSFAQQGQQNLSVTITGQYTHFSSISVVTFGGSGITVGAPTAATLTSLTVPVSIAANAPLGVQGIQVVSGAETVGLVGAFTVTPGTPVITLINPNSGQQGQQNLSVRITGQFTHWLQGTTTATFGAGVTAVTLTVNSATNATASLNIDPAAVLGARTVSLATGAEIASLSGGFSVTANLNQPPIVSAGSDQTISLPFDGFEGSSISSFWTSNGPGTASLSHSVAYSGSQSLQLTASPTFPWAVNLVHNFGFAQSGSVSVRMKGDQLCCGSGAALQVTNNATNWDGLIEQSGYNCNSCFVARSIHGGTEIDYRFTADPAQWHLTEVSVGTGGVALIFDGVTVLTDPSVTSFDEVALTIWSGNGGTVYYDDFSASFGTATLNGSVSDDGLPAGSTLGTNWSLISGPGNVSFSNPTSTFPNVAGQSNPVTTGANFSGPGVYTLGLKGTDSQLSTTSTVTITVNPPGATLLSLNPTSGQEGQTNLSVTITGQFTHFGAGSVVTFSGAGITAGAPTAATLTSLTVPVSIAANAPLGAQGIQVVTGAEAVSLANAFTVTPGTPVITLVNPNTGQPGQTNLSVSISGQFTHFAQGTTVASFGAAISVTSLTVNSATSATVALNIDPGAAVGARNVTITTGTEIATLTNGFTVALVNHPPQIISSPPTIRNWTQLSPAGTIPPGRATQDGNSQAYDETNDRMMFFGGAVSLATDPTGIIADAWVLANASGRGGPPSWIQTTPAISGPVPRQEQSVVYAKSSNRLIVQGGTAPGGHLHLSDTWVLTNANGLGGPSSWIQLPDIPSYRQSHATVYDPGTNRMIVFSGFGGTELNDVWVLIDADGIGSPSWTQLTPAGIPPLAREGTAAVYDQATNRMIVFAGLNRGNGTAQEYDNLNDVWVLTNANGLGGTPQWISLAPSGTPPTARFSGSLVFNPVANGALAFGGTNEGDVSISTFNDLWLLSNANGLGGSPQWTQIAAVGGPPLPRFYTSVGYSNALDQMTLAMGRSDLGVFGNGYLLNDVWVLSSPMPISTVGQTFTYQVNAADPDNGDVLAFSLDAAPLGMSIDSVTGLLQWTPTASQVGQNNVTVRVRDLGGLSGTQTFQITVMPVVSSVSPNSGPAGQSISVAITGQGTHFVQGITTLNFGSGISVGGGIPGDFGPVTVTSPTSATAQVTISTLAPPGQQTVTAQTGSESAVLVGGFNVQGTPALLSVSPNTGQQGQANLSVTITGQFTHFSSSSAVTFSGTGIAAGAPTAATATSLTLQLSIAGTAPLGAQGIQVVTGAETVSLASAFTVTAGTPVITQISPNAGPQGQGGPVGIVGQNTHFAQGTTVVDFGPGITVSNITVSCPTCLTVQLAIAATATVGPRDVTATTGSEVATLPGGFTVLAGTPILTSMNPAGGNQGQTVTSTITGQFTHWVQGTTQVNLGVGITITAVTVTSPTSLTVQLSIDPAASVGTRGLVVTTGTEIVSAPGVFTVQAATPILYTLNPGGGLQGQQNLSVAITGLATHFVQGTSVAAFGAGITVTSLTVSSSTSATAIINIDPAAIPGTRTVTVTTGTESASFVNGFTISASGPIIYSLDPGGSSQGAANLQVHITGLNTHFVQGTSVATFGSGISVTSLIVTNSTTATATITIDVAATIGPRTVTVTTGTEVASFVNGFTVVAGVPGITQINPGGGPQGIQNLSLAVTAQFTHFVQGTTTATVGAGVTVNSITVTDSLHLSLSVSVSPTATIGSRTVIITTGTEVVSAPGGFVVSAGVPTILSVVPPSAIQGQSNVTITITGQLTNFVQGTSAVSLGGAGVTVNSVTVSSATSLTANISLSLGALIGNRTVTVTTGSEIASLANAFTVQSAVNQPPVITIAPTWTDTLPSRLTITYGVSDDGLPLGGALTVSWQTISGPGNVGYQGQTLVCVSCPPPGASGPVDTTGSISVGFDQAGTYVLQIAATDTLLTTTQNVTVTVTGTLPPPPTASISSPSDGTPITTFTDVVGSVASPTLASWSLQFHMQNESIFRPFASGTTAVTNAVLGTFDPTLVLNGLALIQLVATDTYGQTTTFGPISVVVTGNQKVGNFTVAFNDLSVPLAGLPIQVIRTYDSRNKTAGDFGVGWRLDLTTVTLAANGALGDNWAGTTTGGAFPTYCIQPTVAHTVTVSFADGTVFQFQPVLTPACQQLAPLSQTAISFVAISTTPPNASLAIVGNHLPFVNGSFPGPVTLVDLDDVSTFNPDLYQLTMPDGRVLLISQQAGLQSMTDPNGNKLTVTASGIQHSSGKSVSFQRDGTGRITQVTDPNGNVIVYGYDLNNNLVSVTDAAGNITTFTYDGDHGLLTIVDPRGVQPIKNVYDNNGRLIQHVDAFGNTINYTNNLVGQQEVVTDRLGNVTANYYDASGNIIQVTDAHGGNTTRTYDANNNLLTETNPLSQTRIYTYDANNNRLTDTDALGHKTTYTYNSRNQVLTITDPLGHITTNGYDTNGNLTSTQDPAGNTTTYGYNSAGLQTSMTDALGGITTSQYDGSGNLTQQTDPLGNITSDTYDANGNRLSQTRTRTGSSGQELLVTGYQYDALNRVTQTTYPDGSTTKVQYNAIGKQAITTDQLGRQTTYTYDLMGRLLQTTYPDGVSDSSTYDAEGERVTSTDRAGRTTTYVYDSLKRLTKTTFPDLATTKTTYDAAGQIISMTDARGNTTQYQYDAGGRRTQVIDALAHATSFAYNAAGNQTSTTDANGNTTQYQYDNNNRRTKVVYPDITTATTSYDALGRTTAKTDQAGLTTQYSYDKVGRLLQVTDAKGQSTNYSYDEVGNRISQVDANSHATTFAYDKMGRRMKRTLPLGMSEAFTYDSAGNLSTHADFNGKTTTYTFDILNRLTKKVPDASFTAPSVSYTYTATSQRLSMADVSGTTTYGYDLRDRLQTKATPQGTLTYGYDQAGNLSSIRSSNLGGTTVDYAYDVLNRLQTARDNRLAAGTTAYTYDNAGNLSGFQYPNSINNSYTYDALNRLTNLAVTAGTNTVASYGYTLGAAGNRTAVSEFGGRQVTYTYDALYRLTGETIAGASINGTVGYQYDPVGNRLNRISTIASIPTSTSTYDAADRLTIDSYDANGNTTGSGGNSYIFDFENRLLSQNGGAVVIAYDGDGNRVAKTVGGVTTRYLVDDRNLTGYAQVLEELVGGTVQRVYTYGLNRISQSQASGTSFYGYDGHGSVRLLTDSTGAVTDRYDYDAFGNILTQAGTTPNVYLYSGEQNDSNLGLYYLRARYLSQSTGRFMTADRLNSMLNRPSALHRYAFAANNPINRIDPTGNIDLPELTLAIYIQFSVLVFPAVEYSNSTTIQTLLNPTAIASSVEEMVSSGQFDEAATIIRQLAATEATHGPEAFYLGRDALAAAQADAPALGFSVLNSTHAGMLYDLLAAHIGRTSALFLGLGEDISYQWALRATGPVYVYLSDVPFDVAQKSAFYAAEFPTLLMNSNVTSYIVHFADGTVKTLSPALFELLDRF